MSTIEQLAELVAGLRLSDVPSPTVEQLRIHLFDTLGATIAGGATDDGRAIARLVQDVADRGDVPAIGLGVNTSVSFAALAGCAATRCTEIDDIHLESCTTPGSVIVPALLALASWVRRVEAETFLAAMLAGYECLVRFGRAADGPSILYRGVWPTYLSSTFGTAVAAAWLLGLSARETAHAIGTALALTTGTSGRTSGMPSRWLTLGSAVQNGILAALSARHGFRGDLLLLDGGWSKATGILIDHEKLLGGLGTSFMIDQVSIKPYCAAKQATGAIYGFLGILDEERVPPGAIERIVVAVPSRYAPMINRPALPSDRVESIVSVQYQLALAAYHRDELEDVRRSVIHDEPEFRALMAKVSVEEDNRLSRYYPKAWPARVVVHAPAGQRSREVHDTKGDPANPVGWEEAIRKAHRVVSGAATSPAIDRLALACRGLAVSTSPADVLAELLRVSS